VSEGVRGDTRECTHLSGINNREGLWLIIERNRGRRKERGWERRGRRGRRRNRRRRIIRRNIQKKKPMKIRKSSHLKCIDKFYLGLVKL